MPNSAQTTSTITKANNLSQLFAQRVQASTTKTACRHFNTGTQTWDKLSWQDLAHRVAQWQQMLQQFSLQAGDHVAIKLANGPDWLVFDQAAHGLGLVVVPLYVKDRADNLAYICKHADVQLLLLANENAWQDLSDVHPELEKMHILLAQGSKAPQGTHLVQDCLGSKRIDQQVSDCESQTLASIVYTSGTTGRPKGVMLSHQNILANATNGLQSVTILPSDTFLSFLPLSHMLERSIGYYLCIMAGAEISYVRSIANLAEDMQHIQPTVMITVPRIFERIYQKIQTKMLNESWLVRRIFQLAVAIGWHRFEYQQQRANWRPSLWLWPIFEKLVAEKVNQTLGGRLRVIIAGGAALPESVARTFISLGLPILQGYGLTESSPVIAVNRLEQNKPNSIGLALPNEEVKIGKHDELLTKGEHVMLGYWKNEQATKENIDPDGWLHTGDQARIDDHGFIYITGRLKEIIVLSNGEKVPPTDIENAILANPMFEQVMLIGEGRAFLSILAVLNPQMWPTLAAQAHVNTDKVQMFSTAVEKVLLKHISQHMQPFPGYAKIRRVAICTDAWTMENALLTPTLKIRRTRVLQHYAQEIETMYH